MEKKLNFQSWEDAGVLAYQGLHITENMTAGTVLSIRYVAQQKFPLKETKNKFYDGYLSLAASLALLSLRKVYVIISEHSLLCILKTSL